MQDSTKAEKVAKLIFEQKDPNEIVRLLLAYETYVPKEEYLRIFRLNSIYSFPSLLVDKNGLFTAQTKLYGTFDDFMIDKNTCQAIIKGGAVLDEEIEKAILSNHIREVVIDLLLDKDDTHFVNHKCSVYPSNISLMPEIYDTLYLSDYLLKFIYKIFVEMSILGYTNEQIYHQNFIIGYTESEIQGFFKISSIRGRPGFSKLLNVIKLFILKNKLNLDPKLKESYHSFHKAKTDKDILRIYMNYGTISYQSDFIDNKYHIQLQPLEPKCVISFKSDGVYKEIPYYAELIKRFMEEHYHDIREAFPIYKRLENIYRLICIGHLMHRIQLGKDIESFSLEEHLDKLEKCAYIDRYPHSLKCAGGVLVSPVHFKKIEKPTLSSFIQIPFKEHPIVEATQKNIDNKSCKSAFDNGGLICAFAPKLKIRDCYDKNLKDFHECLK
jgi:hypothetical protein